MKYDKDRNMRADKITDHLLSFVHQYDLIGLKDYWGYLNKRFFKRIPSTSVVNTLVRLETYLFRYYIVYAHQSQKSDKVTEFFEQFDSWGNRESWRDWFAFPFTKNPETNPIFEPYFHRVWLDNLHMSLQNFISTVLDAVPLPALLRGSSEEKEEKQQLQREVSVLKMKLQDSTSVSSIPQGTVGGSGGLAGGGGGTLGGVLEESRGIGSTKIVTRSDLDIAEDFFIVSGGVRDDMIHYTDHSSPLLGALFSRGGMFCVTADTAGILKVWTFSPEIRTLHTIHCPVASLLWSQKQDKLLYIGTTESRIRKLNIGNRRQTQELVHPTPGLRIVSLASSGNHLVSSGTDDTTHEVLVWDLRSCEVVTSLDISPLPCAVLCTAFNHNGNLLVTGASDGMIRVYSEYQCIMGWQAHHHPVTTVAFSGDELHVYSYARGVLKQWKTSPISQCIKTIEFPESLGRGIYGSDFVLDGDCVIVSGRNCVRVYRTDTWREEFNLGVEGVFTVDVSVPYSSKLCLTASTSGHARISILHL
eukprot:sb/3463785/